MQFEFCIVKHRDVCSESRHQNLNSNKVNLIKLPLVRVSSKSEQAIRNSIVVEKKINHPAKSCEMHNGGWKWSEWWQWTVMKWFCHVFRRFAACGYIKAQLCYKWTFIGRLVRIEEAFALVKLAFWKRSTVAVRIVWFNMKRHGTLIQHLFGAVFSFCRTWLRTWDRKSEKRYVN